MNEIAHVICFFLYRKHEGDNVIVEQKTTKRIKTNKNSIHNLLSSVIELSGV